MSQLVGYARVSTRDQNPDLQIDALKAAGCTKIFTEQASSVKERPQLAAALDYLREGDTFIFWKLDRLGRSLKDLIHTLDTFRQRGIGVKCLTQPIDTTTPAGRLAANMLGAFAEFEHEMIRERTRAGLDIAIARGRKGGRPSVLDPEKMEMAKVLLADPRLAPASIAKRLGVSLSALYRAFPGGKTALMQAAQAAAQEAGK